MADNLRWFKVWTSILNDTHFFDMPLDDIGRWTMLGALVAQQGEKGTLLISRRQLALILRCSESQLKETVERLPNIEKNEPTNDNGKVSVSLKGWHKYQMDSTGYERLKKWRNSQNDNGLRQDKNKTRKELKDSSLLHREIIEDLNNVLQTSYKHTTKAIKELINARCSEGHTLEDFKQVHRNMHKAWAHDPKMKAYLRPHTLYRGKFSAYLNYKGGGSGRVSEKVERGMGAVERFLRGEDAE